MKKIITLLFAFVAISCGQTLNIVWYVSDAADNRGLEYYVVYKWQGDSTQWQDWQLSDMDSIGTLPHVMNYNGPYKFSTYFLEDKIIRGGVLAQDSLTRRTPMKLSRFYFYPAELTEVRIEK